MASITIGGRKRTLRKSSVILLILIPFVLVAKVYLNYFYNDSGICYNDAPFNSNKLYLTVTVTVESPLEILMFKYASLLGLSFENKRQPSFPANTMLENMFYIRSTSSGRTDCWDKRIESIPMGYDASLTSLPQRNVSIKGYLQSWKYFQSIEQTIRKEFRFKNHILQETKTKFNKYIDKAKESVVVGVHVAGNNVLLYMGDVIQGLNKAPLTYIQNAMKHMRSKYRNVKFLVLCDDRNWCQAYIKGSDDVVFTDEADSRTALILLSLCHHSIVTTGLIGYWGAWLANGHTVYYNDYIRRQSAMAKQIRYNDFFPPHWVPMGI
ncbi:galactoside alpha-(1,2)-fucosyltransferase 2 [Patella vulgata]|uniref:galactoside alpha-(1,2)-fucosyltransferase 2 n=1 Tax=Patella vulgata TaxID=6465 RepID=UPI00217FE125|nr:galactoside alpha-(1,2)-fucosyltransferase 2 [Patella vulgata]